MLKNENKYSRRQRIPGMGELAFITSPNRRKSISGLWFWGWNLTINPNKFISYQKHQRRSELWTVVEGMGIVVLNGKVRKVSRGDFVYIKPNDYHAIKAIEELHIIEVKIGDELIEEDIERFDFDWNSVEVE